MRTTLTLDADVAQMIEAETHRRRQSFKQVVNDAIRRGLSRGGPRAAKRPYRIVPHRATLRPGLDPVGLNRLADELETEAAARKLRRS